MQSKACSLLLCFECALILIKIITALNIAFFLFVLLLQAKLSYLTLGKTIIGNIVPQSNNIFQKMSII